MVRDRTHEPFLKAILQNVEDDAPRLIYADWLEERGDPRGEFIRVQCKVDKLDMGDPALPTLLEREQLLLREYSADWLRDLPPLDDHLAWDGFHRGFPLATVEFWTGGFDESVEARAETFERLARRFNTFVEQGNPACLKLDAALPWDQAPDDSSEYLELLGNSPHLLHVIEVRATNTWVTNRGVKALVTSPHLRTYLRHLDLTCGYTSCGEEDEREPNDEAVEALAGSPRMAYLRELLLDDYWAIRDRGAAALAASPNLARLTRLVVAAWSENGMTKTGEQALQARFGDRVVVNWLG